MRHGLRHIARIYATHSNHAANDSILISFRKVGNINDQAGEVEPWVWAVGPRICELVLIDGCFDPIWSNHGNERVFRLLISLKVCR